MEHFTVKVNLSTLVVILCIREQMKELKHVFDISVVHFLIVID